MPAPATLGKLCTSLDQMQVGDYIKCVYEAPSANVAGDFSHLGDIEPKYQVTSTVNVTNESGAVVYEDDGVTPKTKQVTTEVAYPELPVTPGTTAKGFFYLIKVDKGLLVADRMVQQQISWEALNKKNYIYGGSSFTDAVRGGDVRIRILSLKEFDDYLLNGNLNGTKTAAPVALWHGDVLTNIGHNNYWDELSGAKKRIFIHNYYKTNELAENNTGGATSIISMQTNNITLTATIRGMSSWNDTTSTTVRPQNATQKAQTQLLCQAWAYYRKNTSRDNSSGTVINQYINHAFRPSVAFVDNSNSTSFYL